MLPRGAQLSLPAHIGLTAGFVAVTMTAGLLLPGGLQQAMAFSGIIVVIMVAIFPGVLKIRMARLAHRASAGDVAIGALLIVFGVTVKNDAPRPNPNLPPLPTSVPDPRTHVPARPSH